ncbi:Sensitive to high expression protein [Rhizoctonia solani]|uniref:Sensitive to high expression protein 9, mitochondrial n=1 Tax=Rhizoctonia solani TaxID=456999 RepID=A0A8H8SX93_9AGAM|nr:Sensitive to high expression protein [Rhizoctonia solani]QRW20307.1 Sensitive to high expression protein [Rhizoctonia solani]
MLAARRRLYRPLRITPGFIVGGPGRGGGGGQGTLKPEKTQVEADKIVKEYLDSIKPESDAPSRGESTKPVDAAAPPKLEIPTPKEVSKSDSPTPKPATVTAVTPQTETPKPVPQTDSSISQKPNDLSQPPPPQLSEKLSSDAKKAGQSLAMWKDATLSLLRSRGAEAATQLNALGGKLNKVTGYDEIEALKRKVVEREETISALRASARKAKVDYADAVSTRANRQRQVNDLLQRKSTWTDGDVIAFTKLVREDHASAAAELEAKANLERAEAAVDAEFGRLMRAILDRYHEEQVWSDKIRSVSTCKGPIPVDNKEEQLPPVEPVLPKETQAIRPLPPLVQAELLDKAKALIDSLAPSTDRDYALMAIGGLGGLITSGAVLLFRSSAR